MGEGSVHIFVFVLFLFLYVCVCEFLNFGFWLLLSVEPLKAVGKLIT